MSEHEDTQDSLKRIETIIDLSATSIISVLLAMIGSHLRASPA